MTGSYASTSEQKAALAKLQRKAVELLLPADLEFPWEASQFPDPRMEHLLKLVFIGVDYSTAKSFARVDTDTYAVWLRRSGSSRSRQPDPEPDPAYVYFADCLDLAEACAKARAVWVITASVLNGSVDAAKFWLEKRHREAFGPGMSVQLDEPSGRVQLVQLVLPSNGREERDTTPAIYDRVVEERDLD